jgi:hypothetical protein
LRPTLPGKKSRATAPSAEDGAAVRLIPDLGLPGRLLGALDGRLEVSADRVTMSAATLSGATLSSTLSDGILTIERAVAETMGGRVTLAGTVTLLDRNGKIGLIAEGRADALSGAELAAALATSALDAPLDAAFRVASRGATLRDLVTQVEGSLELALGAGSVAPRTVAPLTASLVAPDEAPPMALRCLVSRIDFGYGKATARAFWLDTARVMVTGRGGLDLTRERLDMTFMPRPRDPRLLAEARDIRVLGAPSISELCEGLSRGVALTGPAALSPRGVQRLLPLLTAQGPNTASTRWSPAGCFGAAAPDLPGGPQNRATLIAADAAAEGPEDAAAARRRQIETLGARVAAEKKEGPISLFDTP